MKKNFLFITMLLLFCLFPTACRGIGQAAAPTENATAVKEESTEHTAGENSKIKSDNDDPFGIAIDACLAYANVKAGEAQDLKVTEIDKNTCRVTFKTGEKDYDLLYNASTGKVTEN